MGWWYIEKPGSIRGFFDEQCLVERPNGEKQRLLDFAIVNLRVGYGAVERVHPDGSRDVFGLVVLMQFRRGDPFDFGYKLTDETMGPCEACCPERILDQLTDPPAGEFAVNWRRRCREHHAKRARTRVLKSGVSFETGSPLSFGGVPAREFTVVSSSSQSLVCRTSPDSRLVRIRRSLLAGMEFVVVR